MSEFSIKKLLSLHTEVRGTKKKVKFCWLV